MGDWCTTYHWLECPHPGAARQVLGRLRAGASLGWPDPERWALRAGLVAPALVHAESVVKYGAHFGLAHAVAAAVPGVRALQTCAGYGRVCADPLPGALVPAWNYMFARTGVDLRDVAAAVGGAAPTPELLCLREPVPLVARALSLSGPPADDRVAALLEALLLGARGLHGRRHELVLGLWTAAHGWQHLARLDLDSPWSPHDGSAEVTLAGGGHQPCAFTVEDGPLAGSIYLERPPAIEPPRVPWPLT